MSNVVKFANDVLTANAALISAITTCRELKERFDADSNLASSALASSGVRTDLLSADWDNFISTASGAWFQIIFSFDAGTPSQKAKMFKGL
jgi:hypothetical protein